MQLSVGPLRAASLTTLAIGGATSRPPQRSLLRARRPLPARAPGRAARGDMADDMLWLFDSVTQFLKGPEWAVPVWDFIDENCIIFDSEEENKLVYHDTFNLFREMVEGLLDMHLTNMGISMEAFAELCETYSTTEVGKEVLEQILAVDDFVSFKKMMVKRNMELELESLRALQQLSDKVEQGAPPDEEEPDDEEACESEGLVIPLT